MDNIVGDHGKNQFANGQSCRVLRTSPEPGMQLMEAIDSIGDFFRFVGISAREIAVNQGRLFENGSPHSRTNGRGNQSSQRSVELPGRGDTEADQLCL
jgi:hypothetical protein